MGEAPEDHQHSIWLQPHFSGSEFQPELKQSTHLFLTPHLNGVSKPSFKTPLSLGQRFVVFFYMKDMVGLRVGVGEEKAKTQEGTQVNYSVDILSAAKETPY